jgi:coenzyme F420-reducing hydrogenase gamma subunit
VALGPGETALADQLHAAAFDSATVEGRLDKVRDHARVATAIRCFGMTVVAVGRVAAASGIGASAIPGLNGVRSRFPV